MVDEGATHQEAPRPPNLRGEPPVAANTYELGAHLVRITGEETPTTGLSRRAHVRLGWMVNNLHARHWFSNMPDHTKAALLLSLQTEGEFMPREDFEGMLGEELECGYPAAEECVVSNLAPGLVSEHVAQMSAPAREVMLRVFVPQVLLTEVGPDFRVWSEYFEYDCYTQARLILQLHVENFEHGMHRYGIPATPGLIRSACRIISAKILFVLCMAFQVPIVEASGVGTQQWADMFEVWKWNLNYFVGEIVFFLSAAYKTVIFNSQLRWECHYEFVPMTEADTLAACMRGDLPDYLCNDFEAWTYRNWNRGVPRAFNIPHEHCGSVYRENELYAWAGGCLFVIGAILAFVLLCLVTTRSLILSLKMFRAIAILSRDFLLVVRSHLVYARNRKIINITEVTQDGSLGAVPTLFKMISGGTVPIDSLEMAVRGSEIRTSGAVPGCVYLAVVFEGTATYIGMGFRYFDYLVTAQHNIFAMTSVPGKYYLIPFADKGEVCELDDSKMLELTREMMDKDIVVNDYPGYDVAIIPIAATAWSRMAVKTLDHSDAIWNANVTVYGLERSGHKKLQRSLGAVVRHEDAALTDVFYTASTLKGWSGSPVLTGQRKVVALHCGTNGEYNRGLNFAYVRFFIKMHELTMLEDSSTASESSIDYAFRGRKGRLTRRREELELEALEDRAHDRAKRMLVCQGTNGSVWFSAKEEVAIAEGSHFRPSREMGWEDECTPPPPINTQNTVPLRVELPPALSPKKLGLFSYATASPFTVDYNETRLSAPYYKGRPEDFAKHLDLEKATELGYTPGVFGEPRATDRESAIKRSKTSLSKCLEQTVNQKLNSEIPSDELRMVVKSLIIKMLAPLRYTVDAKGVTKEKMVSQLHSSAVGCSKSPGLPYVKDGYNTNEALLKAFSVDEVASQAMARYSDGTWQQPSVDFLKLEPTKIEKLDEYLDRNVQATGLDAQLYARCHFSGLCDAAAVGYRKSPIMCGWSPLKPGDGEFLYNEMDKKGRRILEYDGEMFEFIAHTKEAMADVTDVMVGLAVADKGVTSQEMSAWRKDARNFMHQLGMSGYQFPDGMLVSKSESIVLNSGRYDTYIRNSITGLYWGVLAMLDAGHPVDYVKDAVTKKFGGDDVVLGICKDFKLDGFLSSMKRYGMRVHKVKVKEIGEGFDFFSWHFSKNARGEVQWVPTRFSKHIENYMMSKHENRPQALVAHMMNWVHSEPHYDFFKDAFLAMRNEDSTNCGLENLPDRATLLLHLKGLESMIAEPEQVERFLAVVAETQD